jgi:hypothetical protein
VYFALPTAPYHPPPFLWDDMPHMHCILHRVTARCGAAVRLLTGRIDFSCGWLNIARLAWPRELPTGIVASRYLPSRCMPIVREYKRRIVCLSLQEGLSLSFRTSLHHLPHSHIWPPLYYFNTIHLSHFHLTYCSADLHISKTNPWRKTNVC